MDLGLIINADRAEGRPYNDPHKPGRVDVNGVEWWACDPYPTWYRWEDGELRTDPAAWPEDGKSIPSDSSDTLPL